MRRIRAHDFLTNVLPTDDTEIRGRAGTAVLNTLTTDTGFARATHITASTAILTVSLKVCRLDTPDGRSRHTTAVRITSGTRVLTDTIHTRVRCRICRRMFRTRIIACTAVICIRAHDLLTNVLSIDDTEIRGRAGATVLNTLTAHTGFTSATHVTASPAILTVRLKVCRLDAVDTGCRHAAAIRIAADTRVLADAIHTRVGCRIRCRIACTRIITSAAMCRIRTMRVLANVLSIDDTEIRGRAGAAVLNALPAHAGFASATDDAASAAILTVCLKVCRLDTLDGGSRHTTAVRVARGTRVLTDTCTAGI